MMMINETKDLATADSGNAKGGQKDRCIAGGRSRKANSIPFNAKLARSFVDPQGGQMYITSGCSKSILLLYLFKSIQLQETNGAKCIFSPASRSLDKDKELPGNYLKDGDIERENRS